MRPYVAKIYFETYKSYDHMQKIRPISQNFNQSLNILHKTKQNMSLNLDENLEENSSDEMDLLGADTKER